MNFRGRGVLPAGCKGTSLANRWSWVRWCHRRVRGVSRAQRARPRLHTLELLAVESQWESSRVFELLALAAASMGTRERQRALDERITKLRRWKC